MHKLTFTAIAPVALLSIAAIAQTMDVPEPVQLPD